MQHSGKKRKDGWAAQQQQLGILKRFQPKLASRYKYRRRQNTGRAALLLQRFGLPREEALAASFQFIIGSAF